jgi:acetylornithine deacetylase/succinyl-diaminopimelate desuccinylase-like protein
MDDVSDPSSYIDRHLARFQDQLFEFLRIPSVSARSEHDEDTEAAARWFADQLRSAGLDAEIHPTARHPIVMGEWRGAGPEAATLLIYGHYDVQPAEPLRLWDSPPFEPTIRDGRIYARGSADDKGQLFMHVKAIESHLKGVGSLPVNVVVLAEGEEEIGSPSLVPFVEANRDLLACDTVVISDSTMFAPGIPSLLFSLRGLAYLELHVEGPSSDLHSGAYGGAVINPANALADLLAGLHDESGAVAIPGFYDDVREWDQETRAALRELPFDEDEFRRSVGVEALGGEAGFSTLERLWMRPTCDVCGIESGYTGQGAKTVLPAHAMAKVSFRLVPDQDPATIERLFEEHVRAVAPAGVRVRIERLHGGKPWRAQLGGRIVDAATRALRHAFEAEPVLVGEGGSIPIVVDFEEILGASALLVGFALPGANMHAPNEWFPTENFDAGIRALARLYQELAS